MGNHVTLGAFRVDRPLGHGGMAQVWRATHALQDVEVALKVMNAPGVSPVDARALFRAEVGAVAGLDHPGIVIVFDQGEVDGEAEEASAGVLRAGSPYLAMELAAGTLRDSVTISSFAGMREVLCQVLEALAHSHARGVVHRDVKPTNVLLCGAEGARRLKLADFGLAFALDRQGGWHDDVVSGTPSYMAPEQLGGHWRDYGPWTDLYGVGCVAYELACGRAAFGRQGAGIRAEQRRFVPALAPLLPLPRGFEAWVHRLLMADPRHRFQRAADALHALLGLSAAEGIAMSVPVLPDQPTGWLAQEQPTTAASQVPEEEESAGAPFPGPAEAPAPRPPAPMPADWRRSEPDRRSQHLTGAGLGLFGLRTVPVVGREPERTRLWELLRDVRAHGRVRAAVLSGATGQGKTYMAGWLCERAHEVGAATALKAFHGPLGGPGDGLPRMVARFLRCVGLDPDALLRRTETLVRAQGVDDPAEWRGLAALMAPAACPGWRGGEAAQSAGERHALGRRLILRAARKRPVIVVLDDVQWGADALRFASALLDDGRGRILVLLTVNEALIPGRPREQELLARVAPRAERIDVPPLGGAEQARLVAHLLDLEPALAAAVQERTGGNPLFAVHLVDDWVQRGALLDHGAGYVLRAGEAVPRDVREVWARRVLSIEEAAGAGARPALEIAAALGQWVSSVEWAAACAVAGLSGQEPLVDLLVAQRLARRVQGGWTFSHDLVRGGLEGVARESGRWAAANEACAEALRERLEGGERGMAERVGRHFMDAGRPGLADEPLLRGAREHRETSDYRVAASLLELREEAMRRAAVPAGDPRWGEGWTLRARVALHEGDLAETSTWAARAEREGGRQGWRAIRADALRLLGDTERRHGDLDAAERLYRRCLDLPDGHDVAHGRAGSLWGLGDVCRQRGQLDRALACFAESRDTYDRIGDAHGVADFWIGAADVAFQAHDLPEARVRYARAESMFDALGNRYGVARAVNGAGEVARARGQLDEAALAYERAESLLELVRSADVVFPQLNRALVDLARGRIDATTPRLMALRDETLGRGWRGLQRFVDAALLCSHARSGDWAAWDAAIDALETRSAPADPDLVSTLTLAAGHASEAGDPARAARATAFALAQARILGDEGAVARLTAG